MAGTHEIPDIPFAQQNSLNLLPARVPKSAAVEAAGTLSGGTQKEITLTAGAQIVLIESDANAVIWRWRKSGDANGVTLIGGSYPYQGKIPPFTILPVPIPKDDTYTSVVLDYLAANSKLTIFEY